MGNIQAQYPKSHWLVLSFLFAIRDVNRNPNLLPNVTLGYSVYENFGSARMTYNAMIDLASSGQENIPNYSCGPPNTVLAVLENAATEISVLIANVMGIYKIPQISYAFVSHALQDEAQFPFLYRMFPNEEYLYPGILKLLRHFRWTWVGLIAPDTDNGERFLSTLTPMLTRNSICALFSLILPQKVVENYLEDVLRSGFSSKWTRISVVIYYAETELAFFYGIYLVQSLVTEHLKLMEGKVWVTNAWWDLSSLSSRSVVPQENVQTFFSFLIRTNKQATYNKYHPFHITAEQLWRKAFRCSYSKHELAVRGWTRCMERRELEIRPEAVLGDVHSGHGHSIYQAVHAVAQALHAFYLSTSKSVVMAGGDKWSHQRIQRWKMYHFLKNFWLSNTSIEGVHLDEDGDLAADLDIVKSVTFPNDSLDVRTIGNMKKTSSQGVLFNIDKDNRVWPRWIHQEIGKGLCKRSCAKVANSMKNHA
uniref:Uncharacterized protein n=1 Tax=Sphaerodactylus townsendi TaxID=933632 RepID=A0ACB8G7L1_9SAUR